MKKAIRRRVYLIMSELKDHKNELVSIIVPVYNQERYLEECVQSIQKQTYRNLEIILVDDGSTDKSGAICEKLSESDKRIIVIHKQNGGVSAARYDGVMNSHGDWIMFVDNDDVLSPYAISLLLDNISDSIDIVSAGRIDSDIEYTFSMIANHYVKTIYSGKEICENIPEDEQQTIITPLWGKIYRKNYLDRIDFGRYRKKCPTIFFEDVLMTPILFYNARKICVIEQIIYFHREVPTSISRSGKLSSFYYEQIYSGDFLLQFSKEKGLKSYYRYELAIYLDSILRIWCLADESQFEKYRLDIIHFYKKYITEYLFFAKKSFLHRIMIVAFGLSKSLWKSLANKFYFNGKR